MIFPAYKYPVRCGVRHSTKEYFLIANEDRHFNNFGLLRNADTLKWIGVTPVFDCGTSLWYNTLESQIRPRSSLLAAKPFKKTHTEQIGLVTDFSWVDLDALAGLPKEAGEILMQSPFISKERREVLCDALKQRIELLCRNEPQSCFMVSHFCEKRNREYPRSVMEAVFLITRRFLQTGIIFCVCLRIDTGSCLRNEKKTSELALS